MEFPFALFFGVLITASDIAATAEQVMEEINSTPNLVTLSTSAPQNNGYPTTHRSASETRTRSKRFLFLNIDGSLDVGFLLTIPITIVLPPMSNLFNSWRYRRRRTISDSAEGIPLEEDDPIFQGPVGRIQTYFELIELPEPACQSRAICEFASEPQKYFPLAELILREIRNPGTQSYLDNIRMQSNKPGSNGTSSLFMSYDEALQVGLSQGRTKCQSLFQVSCPFSTEKRLNVPLFQFWNLVRSLLDIKFKIELN